MTRKLLIATGLMCFLSSATAYPASVYDDFSSTTLSEKKWQYPEAGKHIANGELTMELRAFDQNFLSTQLAFAEPETKDSISGVFNISTAHHYNHTAGDFVAAGFEGSFYNGIINLVQGDIIAGFYIIHSNPTSTAAQVMYQIWLDDGSGWQVQDTYIFPSGVVIGSDITLAIEYDGADRIRFSFSSIINGSPVSGVATWYGPGRESAPTKQVKRAVVGVGGQNDPGSGHVISTIDTVQTAAASGGTYGTLAAYDNFSVSGFDSSKWFAGDNDLTGFCRRDVESGMLLLEAEHDNTGSTGRFQFDARLPESNFSNFLQADVIIAPSSAVSGIDGNTDRGEMRLEAFWFNDTHDGSAGNAYNGDEGLVTPVLKVMSFNDGSNAVKAQIYRCSNADCSSFSEILNSSLGCSVVQGQPNTLTMKKAGSTFIFICDDAMVQHNFAGSMYAHQFDVRRFRLRAYASPGESTYYKSSIDNVSISGGFPWATFLPVIISPAAEK